MASRWTPDLIIALVLVLGSFTLIASGIDGEVKSVLTLSAGWAFGSQFKARQKPPETKDSQ